MMDIADIAVQAPRNSPHGMDGATLEARALSLLFDRLDQSQVTYAVLRNYEALPRSVGARDIDIVVLPQHLRLAHIAVCSIATELQCAYANYYRDERLVQFALFKRLDCERFFELKVDFFTNSQVYGVEILPASKMLDGVRRHNGVAVVRESLIVIDKLVFHLLVGQSVHPKYDAEFARISATHRSDLIDTLLPIVGGTLTETIVEAIARGKTSAMRTLSIRQRAAILTRCIRNDVVQGARHMLAFLYHRARNRLSPEGLFLSVSGPDGSGKTTVINAVIAALDQLYGNGSVAYGHFRPSLLPRIAEVARATRSLDSVDEDYSRPHRATPSGLAGSLLRLAYYGADYVLGYAARVRPILIRRRIALFDRYYYDMIGDPGRSRISLPRGLLRVAACVLPLPHLAFFIRVSPEIAFSRKQELSLCAIAKLNERYDTLVRQGLLIAIDNDQHPALAVARIVDTVVERRDARSRRRLRWVLNREGQHEP
jgi:thymidylate kinase